MGPPAIEDGGKARLLAGHELPAVGPPPLLPLLGHGVAGLGEVGEDLEDSRLDDALALAGHVVGDAASAQPGVFPAAASSPGARGLFGALLEILEELDQWMGRAAALELSRGLNGRLEDRRVLGLELGF